MPFVAAVAPKCGTCGKSVYAAEEVKAFELSFHKMCFKCADCKKSLDSTNATSHEEEGVRSVYCKACYGKHFGPGVCRSEPHNLTAPQGFRGGSGGTGILAPTGADAPAPVNAGHTDADALTAAGQAAARADQ